MSNDFWWGMLTGAGVLGWVQIMALVSLGIGQVRKRERGK